MESEIEILDERKVNFTFLSAGLKFSNGFTLPVPPVGKGWFENIYVGERYRVLGLERRYFDRRAVLKAISIYAKSIFYTLYF